VRGGRGVQEELKDAGGKGGSRRKGGRQRRGERGCVGDKGRGDSKRCSIAAVIMNNINESRSGKIVVAK